LLQQHFPDSGEQVHSLVPLHTHLSLMQFTHSHFGLLQAIRII